MAIIRYMDSVISHIDRFFCSGGVRRHALNAHLLTIPTMAALTNSRHIIYRAVTLQRFRTGLLGMAGPIRRRSGVPAAKWAASQRIGPPAVSRSSQCKSGRIAPPAGRVRPHIGGIPSTPSGQTTAANQAIMRQAEAGPSRKSPPYMTGRGSLTADCDEPYDAESHSGALTWEQDWPVLDGIPYS